MSGDSRPSPSGSNPDIGAIENSRAVRDAKAVTVKNDGSGDYATIQSAIDATDDGDTVLVYPGTYQENLQINSKNIVLGSQYLNNGDTSYVSSTIVNGNSGSGPCISITYVDSTCQIVGLRLTNGSPGIAVYDQSDNTSPVIKRCKIDYNYDTGVKADGGNLKLVHCEISNNYGSGCGFLRGVKTVRNCKIYSNSQHGIDLYEEAATVTNCLIASNGSDGIWLRYNYPLLLTNSTIVGNGEHGLDLVEGGRPTVRNTIIANNQSYEIYFRNSGVMIADVDYSLIQGGEAEGIYFEGQNDPTLNWGDNNLTDNNVMFNDLTNGDYRLSNYSPAIGAGTSNGAPRFDLNGASRPSPSNSNPDMGAYENALGTQSHNEFIYVNTEGSDAGSVGLESSPFETIQSAIDYSLDGDTVLILWNIH